MDFPSDLRYTKDHEWARLDGDNVVVGITAFAVEQLGDITMVELPGVGDDLSAEDSFGVVESVKSVSELYAPVDGSVVAVNEELEEKPELVNESCYGDGWIVAIKPNSAADLDKLLDQGAYAELVADES